MSEQVHLLKRIEALFFRLGIKNITMDFIAKELGVSKKTIYACVSSKDELVYQIMTNHLEQERKNISNILSKSENAIDEMIWISNRAVRYFRSLNASTLFDLQRYYPRSWDCFLVYKNDFIHSIIIRNLHKGMNQGLYREQISVNITVKLYLFGLDSILHVDHFPSNHYDITEVYRTYIEHYLRGLFTSLGLEYYLDKIKNERDV